MLCSCPAALQNAAFCPYTPASRRSVSNAGEKTVYHRKSLSSNKSSIALGTPPCAYSHRTVCRAIASRTPALGLRWPLRRIARFCLSKPFHTVEPAFGPRKALAALYFQYLQPPSGRYSPHKSLHAIHTATPLAKAQITLHRPRLVERPFTLPAPATAYQALAALYSQCPRPPSGRYSPHKSLHAAHTAHAQGRGYLLHFPLSNALLCRRASQLSYS